MCCATQAAPLNLVLNAEIHVCRCAGCHHVSAGLHIERHLNSHLQAIFRVVASCENARVCEAGGTQRERHEVTGMSVDLGNILVFGLEGFDANEVPA